MFSLHNLCFGFEDQPRLFNNLSVDFSEKRMGILGDRKSGKSTLLLLMIGLRVPCSGTITAFDEVRTSEADFQEVRRRAGLLFQDPNDQLVCLTVFDDVAFGPQNLEWNKKNVAENVQKALDQVGIASLKYSAIHRLTWQEKKWVCLAGILAMTPEVILLDAPEQGLAGADLDHLLAVLDPLPQTLIIASDDSPLSVPFYRSSVATPK